jgi:hypothetical protein
MDSEKDQKKDQKQETKQQTQIQTPPPPQVIDPSRPPGQGAHETYQQGEEQKKNEEKKEKDVKKGNRGENKSK